MNVLFLNNGRFASAGSHSIYSDLMREFQSNGNDIYVVSANERRNEDIDEYYEDTGIKIVCVRIGNLTNSSLPEKALTTLTIANKYISAIKKYYSEISFDLVIYPTPPITLLKVVEYVKKRDNAKSFLLLKDIFPQNAVDIGMMSKNGIKGFLYRYFRRIEKKFYATSDFIGCMSEANAEYVLKHNPEVNPNKVRISPNCIEVIDKSVDADMRNAVRAKYGIPLDKKVFVYGGNFGKPQGVPFLIECLKKCRDIDDVYFLIAGDGTEYGVLKSYIENEKPTNVILMKRLPKEDYDTMVGACDVGLIFLDHRFTIPNFPSRLLCYNQAKIPVIACTDPNTDIGKVITEGGFGWWCESNSADGFVKAVSNALNADLKDMGEKGYSYLDKEWNVAKQYKDIANTIGC